MFKYKHIYIASCGKESGIYHYVVKDDKIINCPAGWILRGLNYI